VKLRHRAAHQPPLLSRRGRRPRPEVRADRSAEADRRFPAAAVSVTVVSVVLFAAAWVLFDAGRPGAPIFPDERPNYGFTNTVTVYLPREARATWSWMNFAYTLTHDARGRETATQTLNINLAAETTGVIPAIVELRGAARIDDPRSDSSGAETIDLPDRQLILLEFPGNGSRTQRLDGNLRTSPVAVENSRTAFVSPSVGLQSECDSLGAFARAGELAKLTSTTWNRISGTCAPTTFKRETYMVLATGDTPVRVDYIDVMPWEAAGSPSFIWKSENPLADLQVRTSFVDINGEAAAQRLLFLSGVVVGLAAATSPFAVQGLAVYAVRRWRRRRGVVSGTGGR
jgi:hypothetical protein